MPPPDAPRLITFDLGNVLTLVDEGPAIREYARLGGKSEQEVFEVCYSPEAKRTVETGQVTFPQFAALVMDRLELEVPLERFIEIFEWSLSPNKPIFELVDQVASRYRVALCSNTSEPHWELERRRLPFSRRFDPAIVSYEVGAMKPDRRIYDALSERSGISHRDIVFIDDSLANVEGAAATGIRAIHFTGVQALRKDLRTIGVLG